MRFNYQFENKKGMKIYKKELFVFTDHVDINLRQTKYYNAWTVKYKVNGKNKYKNFNLRNKCLYKTKREAYKFLKQKKLEEYYRIKNSDIDVELFERIYNPKKRYIHIDDTYIDDYEPIPKHFFIM